MRLVAHRIYLWLLKVVILAGKLIGGSMKGSERASNVLPLPVGGPIIMIHCAPDATTSIAGQVF